MLPYSPLHHLLLADVGVPLVMTSGNVSDEPIAYDDDALERLVGHRRPVPAARPADPHAGRRLGRARRADRAALARLRARDVAGRERAAAARGRRRAQDTFALARDGRAWVSHHIGDLRNYETLRSFTRRHRALRAAVRGRRPSWSRTTCTPSTSRPSTRSTSSCRRSASSTTTPTSPLPGRARRGAGGGRDLRRHRLRHRRHRLGRRAAARRPRTASSASATSGRCGCPAARPRSASRGGWPAPGSLEIGRRPLPPRVGAGRRSSPAPASPRR